MKYAIIAAASAVAASSPAAANELFGVKVGDTLETAMARFPTGKFSSLPEAPDEGMLIDIQRGRIVTTCRGVVDGVQEEFGATTHDFAATVQSEMSGRGVSRPVVKNYRSPVGEVSSISFRWPVGSTTEYEVSLFQAADRPIKVTRSYVRIGRCR